MLRNLIYCIVQGEVNTMKNRDAFLRLVGFVN